VKDNGHGPGNGSNHAQHGPAKVGVIGCGYWGPQLIRNFSEMPEAALAGVADSSPDRLQYVRQRYPGVPVYQDYRELLETDVDAVVIATPIETHFALAREALRAGKHVLVEKPLALSVADAASLIGIARVMDRTLMSGHTFLYNPAVVELRRLVQSGELGRIFYVDAARLSLGLFQRHVNVIWDLAPHDISILLYVLGTSPVAVSARGSSCVRSTVHDVAYVEVQFEGGISAQLHVSWLDPAKVRRITVVGDRKMAVYNDVSLAEKIRIYDKGVEPPPTDNFGEFQLSYRNGQITIPYVPWQEPLRTECEHFVECIQSGTTPLTDGYQGLAVVAVLEAANQSLVNGGLRVPVHIPTMVDVATSQSGLKAANGHAVSANGNGHQVGPNGNGHLIGPNGNGHDPHVNPVSSVAPADGPAVAFPEQ
jgi:predicted dehydrogenase